MPSYRHDPLTDHWVIIAPERLARPDELCVEPSPRRIVAPCPFCRGHEEQTPSALATYPDGEDSAWQVRVVTNKFPAVQPDAAPATDQHPRGRCLPGRGVHEVIIQSPDHVVSCSQLTDEQMELSFVAYRDRIRALKRDERLAYALVFKNARSGGGASLEHCHSQLLATSMVPTHVQREWARAGEHRAEHRSCIFCDMLAGELDAETRLVTTTPHFAAVAPFASRFPYETWVLPRGHASSFEDSERHIISELALLVRDLIRRLERLLGEPAYNYWIHNAPFQRSPYDDYHWHLELVPRLTRLAGFELGGGYFINPVSPEEAASCLRFARVG